MEAVVSLRGCCLRCTMRTLLFGKVKFGLFTSVSMTFGALPSWFFVLHFRRDTLNTSDDTISIYGHNSPAAFKFLLPTAPTCAPYVTSNYAPGKLVTHGFLFMSYLVPGTYEYRYQVEVKPSSHSNNVRTWSVACIPFSGAMLLLPAGETISLHGVAGASIPP